MIRHGVEKLLRRSGFDDLTIYNAGAKAWSAIESEVDRNEPMIDLILSDIEMPGLDGLHLTKKIREDSWTKNTKAILFSSIVNPNNDNKGNFVGADAQIEKNSDYLIINTIHELLG